jgi:hypothetical protein
MHIEQTILERWKSIRRPGDAKAIAQSIGCTVNLVYIAFQKGKCSKRVFDAISNYYLNAQQRLDDMLERTAHLVTNE